MENAKRNRTSMSVPEMRKLLGIGKTDSYWLIKRNYFTVITVGGKMRVMIDSFENWYANQTHYKKVDGTPPGEELLKSTMTVDELGKLLGIAEGSAYELIARGHFTVIDGKGKRRITKESFERWYAGQDFYRTVEEQAADQAQMDATFSIPEIGRMLGYHRNCIYPIVNKGVFDVIQIGRYKRVTKDSFYRWLNSQTHYKLVDDKNGMERR